jgi:hypothetical protein
MNEIVAKMLQMGAILAMDEALARMGQELGLVDEKVAMRFMATKLRNGTVIKTRSGFAELANTLYLERHGMILGLRNVASQLGLDDALTAAQEIASLGLISANKAREFAPSDSSKIERGYLLWRKWYTAWFQDTAKKYGITADHTYYIAQRAKAMAKANAPDVAPVGDDWKDDNDNK